MVSIGFFNSPPQYCLLSRWFFPDPKKVLWVSDSLHIVHNESSHLTRGPGSGLLSLLFWPLSMMLIVAPLWERNISFEPQIMFRYHQVPDLPDFVDLAAPLPNDRSNHVVGDRHLMPGFWFSIQRHQKNWIFMKPNICDHFVQRISQTWGPDLCYHLSSTCLRHLQWIFEQSLLLRRTGNWEVHRRWCMCLSWSFTCLLWWWCTRLSQWSRQLTHMSIC